MTRRECKERAKAQLKGNWGQLILMSFLAMVILSASSFTFIGAILLMGPIMVGMAIYLSKFVRKGETKLETMFEGFSDFGGNFLLGLLQTLFIFLWGLLFVIPGIVKTYSYSACYFIKHAKPELSATEAIQKSREIMNGHKWELFVLDLSFIGWAFLTVFTFGIGMLWLYPYMEVTRANYFVSLLREAGIMEQPTPEEEGEQGSDEEEIAQIQE